MSAPDAAVSDRFVWASIAIAAATVLTIVGLALWAICTPIMPPVESRPIPAPTAGPAPITPVPLTEMPMHQRGPQALRTPEETR